MPTSTKTARAEPSTNGHDEKREPLPNGRQGSVVLVCTELGLAEQFRKVAMPAACNTMDSARLKAFVQSRAAVVVYGRKGKTQSEVAATYLQTHCNAEKVGTIDLTDKMGYPGQAKAFISWWEDAMGMGHFEDGPDFLRQVEQRATWRGNHPLATGDEEKEADVKDPIGQVADKAFHGPLGELAILTQPETEANALFVLMHLLAFFVTAVGRGPHFVISGSKHYLNLFVALIGLSGRGRKQTAADVAREIFRKIDPAFVEGNITNGLNSGAGLLIDLRDPSIGKGKKGEPVVDAGVDDKRRVYLQPELSAVLKQGHRESDPLLEYLRMLFDGADRIGSKTVNPQQATGALLTLFGHCTPDDLKIHLSESDKANGTANRMLFLFGVRSKRLPRGGDVFALLDFLDPQLARVRRALELARDIKRIRRHPSIEQWWEDEVYPKLDDIPPGKLGALFVRATTIVMRIASGFALADLEEPVEDHVLLVQRSHLEAALAIWDHSGRSLRYIFKSDADPRAEKLLAALKKAPGGRLTRTQIYRNVFGGNTEAEVLDPLLERLLAHQEITRVDLEPKGGRAAVCYELKKW